MPSPSERIFYEMMHRASARGEPFPRPWWVQQYLRHWVDAYDGLFDSKEQAFASNAHYRYWNMVGVKDHRQESLVGQAGEVESVYDRYALGFFLFDPTDRRLYFPQHPRQHWPEGSVRQELQDGCLPVIRTISRPQPGLEVLQTAFATVVEPDAKSVVVVTYRFLQLDRPVWFCLSVTPFGPTGLQRNDRAGRYRHQNRVSYIRYRPELRQVVVSTESGPLFDLAPAHVGLYGNPGSEDPEDYLARNPFHDLATTGGLNGAMEAADFVAGLCMGAFAWEVGPSAASWELGVRLPVDDFRGEHDLADVRRETCEALARKNETFWRRKLTEQGIQLQLPAAVAHLADLFRVCRANLLVLADGGRIHPGPTIYDEFWIRDSCVEGIACALCGDGNLAERQFGTHYSERFNVGPGSLGDVELRGFFGGRHEKDDREWDSNGEALWAIGRFDRIYRDARLGAAMFHYVLEGARWLGRNRVPFSGLLPSGWSAEHLGDKDKPHYWDDLWAVAGLYEAVRLAERLGHEDAADEIRAILDDLRRDAAASIRWVLGQQDRQGIWKRFIPTGPHPSDATTARSTMIGTVAYFHPCRLYMDRKMGALVDNAARWTLTHIWENYIDGGFRHDTAWRCYGPYLTLQLAHAYLLVGELHRMDPCLGWCARAAFAQVSDGSGHPWQVVLGAWNEQHCYPVAKDFAEVPDGAWYMGDIPHGWACAEFLLLLRDILFFEASEDDDPHLYVAPGVLDHWVGHDEAVEVRDAPTVFGVPFGYRLVRDDHQRTVELEITQPVPEVRMVLPCQFGLEVEEAEADGRPLLVVGRSVHIPAGATRAIISYR